MRGKTNLVFSVSLVPLSQIRKYDRMAEVQEYVIPPPVLTFAEG